MTTPSAISRQLALGPIEAAVLEVIVGSYTVFRVFQAMCDVGSAFRKLMVGY